MVILLSAAISYVNNFTSVINNCYCLKMMKKDPVRLYCYSILPLMIIKRLYILRCLDCNAEVSAKVKSALGRDVTVFFFFCQKI